MGQIKHGPEPESARDENGYFSVTDIKKVSFAYGSVSGRSTEHLTLTMKLGVVYLAVTGLVEVVSSFPT